MAKARQHDVLPGHRKRKNKKGISEGADDEDWVVVKKQKVTILIPSLPGAEQTAIPNSGNRELQEKSNHANSLSLCTSGTGAEIHSDHDRQTSMTPSPREAIPAAMSLKLSRPRKMGAENSLIHGRREASSDRACSARKVNNHMLISIERSTLLNQRMRASYLEKKLQRAGGLNNWLLSLGLGRFVKIFQRKNVNKFHLSNLTMQKLKDLGAHAVGPRRKLMHAIECLCQPHCFQHL